MKTILVTGGYGLVGRAIENLRQGDYYFIFLNSKMCDLTNYTETLNFFQELKPDIIIHLAACVGGLFKNMSQRVKMFEENILMNTHVIKIAHLIGVQDLIACLSTCVFPENDFLNETILHDGPPHPSNEGYAYAKRMLEVHCRVYREQFGRNYNCIIPTNIYGPHDNFNLEDSHVIPALIHKCYLAIKNNTPFEIKGSGKPLRQFIYSMDLAKIIFILLEKKVKGCVILSPTQEYSIKTVAEMIKLSFEKAINNSKVECLINNKYSDGIYRKTADNSKLNSILPDFEFTSLKDGIDQSVNWFIENYSTLRK